MADRTDDADVAALLARMLYAALVAGADDWAQLSLSIQQLKVLLLVARHGPVSVGWLAAGVGVSAGTVTGILDRLEDRGWVQRTSDPRDRRVVRATLTPAGQGLIEDLHAAGLSALVQAAGKLPPGDRDALHRSLAALIAAAEVGG